MEIGQHVETISPYTAAQIAETAFEKRRGISSVEIREGLAQAQVSGLAEPVMERRIEILERVAQAGVSIDFLKLTQDGLSFIISESSADAVRSAIDGLARDFSVIKNQHILLVHAVNMRDEEGLIADVMKQATASGVSIDHVTDMHDRMLMVVDAGNSERLKERLLTLVMGGGHAR